MAYQFELVEGTDTQIKILYDLLKKRIHSISHSTIPNYDAHTKFVKHHPYRKWYLVKLENDYFGSFYIKNDNSIGLNLNQVDREIVMSCIKFIHTGFRPRREFASMVPNYFYINIPSTNIVLIKVMQSLSFPKLQISFKI